MTINKGIAVISGSTDVVFKFLDDGTSQLGKDADSVHDFSGSVNVTGTVLVSGSMEFTSRVAGYRFGLPSLDATDPVDASALAELVGENSASYNGFMFFLDTAAQPLTPPFNLQKKIYFCEDGTWHPSPFYFEDDE